MGDEQSKLSFDAFPVCLLITIINRLHSIPEWCTVQDYWLYYRPRFSSYLVIIT